MKIAFVVHTAYPDYIGGREHHVHHLAAALSQSDEVTVFAGGRARHAQERRINGYTLVTLPSISLSLSRNPLQVYRIIPQLHRRLAREKFDVVHAFEYGSFSTHVAYRFARARSLPLFLTVYSYQLKNPLLTACKIVYDQCAGKSLFSFTEKIFCVSSLQRSELVGILGKKHDERKIVVLPNCIPTGEFETIEGPFHGTQASAGKQIRLLTLTRILPRKGIKHLIFALHKVVHTHRFEAIKLTVAGPDCGESASIRSIVSRLRLEDKVDLCGAIAYERTRELLAASDIFVLPSLYEGLPLAVLEAMAAGRAVIFSNLPCSHQIIDHGINGLLTRPGDVDDLAEAILRLCRNQRLRETLGGHARITVKRFDSRHEINSLKECYLKALKK